MKRVFDFFVAAAATLVLVPVIVVVAFGVRMNLGSPILFRQARPGRMGRPFTLLKFRTMRNEFGEGGEASDAARLTRFGRFLRRTSLDEVPELLNVLRGEMSLVGPRPLLMEYLPLYSPEQSRRHEVKPGITGWAQVKGRNALSWEDKFKLDVWYVDHRSFLLDLRILWMTLGNVLSGKDVSQPGHATVERFRGAKT